MVYELEDTVTIVQHGLLNHRSRVDGLRVGGHSDNSPQVMLPSHRPGMARTQWCTHRNRIYGLRA